MLRHQTATLLVTVGTLVLTLFLYVVVPKGFFPVQDTGVILGISEAPQNISFAAMAERQQALAKVILQGSGRGEPVVVHRHRRNEHDAEQRTHSDQPEAARASAKRRRREIIRRLQPELAKVEGITLLHAAGAGPDGGRPRQPHAVSIHAGRCRCEGAERLGAASWWRSCSTLPELRDVASDQQNQRTCRRSW